MHRQPPPPIRHGHGDGVGANDAPLAIWRCHHGRGVGKADAQLARLRDLFGKITKRGASMALRHGQHGHACFIHQIAELIFGRGKGGLGKTKPRIRQDRSRLWTANNRHDLPINTPRGQLHTIAFDILQAANHIAMRLGMGSGAGHLPRLPCARPMGHERGFGHGFNLADRHLRHGRPPYGRFVKG